MFLLWNTVAEEIKAVNVLDKFSEQYQIRETVLICAFWKLNFSKLQYHWCFLVSSSGNYTHVYYKSYILIIGRGIFFIFHCAKITIYMNWLILQNMWTTYQKKTHNFNKFFVQIDRLFGLLLCNYTDYFCF